MTTRPKNPARPSRVASFLKRLLRALRPRLRSRTSEVAEICRRAAAGDLEARITGMGFVRATV